VTNAPEGWQERAEFELLPVRFENVFIAQKLKKKEKQ
jgi:hypothetical protein